MKIDRRTAIGALAGAALAGPSALAESGEFPPYPFPLADRIPWEEDLVFRVVEFDPRPLYDVFVLEAVASMRIKQPDGRITEEPWHFEIDEAWTKDGLYVGDPETAEHFTGKLGLRNLQHFPRGRQREFDHPIPVCVGFQPELRGWAGWSHRAKHTFFIGDALFDESFPDPDEKLAFCERGWRRIRTLDEARIAAGRFARYVA